MHKNRYLTIDEVADYLQVKKSVIYHWTHMKAIPYYKLGRFLRFKREEIDEWIKLKKVEVFNSNFPT